jgi:ParB family transcriptional regulator, chromosome partitioning protein
MDKKSRLGRGLDALLGGPENATGALAARDGTEVPLDRIEQNPFQPRRTFDADELSSLSDSIRAHGVLQPLVVRLVGDRYQIIAGERRLRAARAAGLPSVPVRVVDFNDQQVLEAALVENIQRTDLNPIEKAHGFKEYLERFKMTHEQLAARLGLARTTITNLLGLLDLPPEVQDAVRTGQLSTGHAKILKGLTDRDRQISLAREIIARALSVHAAEALLKQPPTPEVDTTNGSARVGVAKTKHVQAVEDELRKKLATRVEIRLKAKDKGQIVLAFESNDDFERLLELLRK